MDVLTSAFAIDTARSVCVFLSCTNDSHLSQCHHNPSPHPRDMVVRDLLDLDSGRHGTDKRAMTDTI